MALTVFRLGKKYSVREETLEIFQDCSFELTSGESLSISGPSGSGKSTLLSILGTLEPASTGSVFLEGVDISALSANRMPKFRQQNIGFVFQDHHLLPQCSALENVLLPFLAEGRIRSPQRQKAVELLDRVGLSSRQAHRPSELSGGERQRVAIARALVKQPKLILADEPTGNLDHTHAEHVGNLLLELAESAMLILVTHDPKLASRTQRRMTLHDGKLVENR